MEIVTEWVRNVFIVIAALSFVEILLPVSTMEKYVKFIFALMIMATVLSPLAIILE